MGEVLEVEVRVASGSLREVDDVFADLPHRWSGAGVTATGAFTGAHLLHLAIGGCVLNDVHREAVAGGVPLQGVRVTVRGGFDTATWASTGADYRVEVDTTADAPVVAALLDRVEAVAEIPAALRRGVAVRRTPST